MSYNPQNPNGQATMANSAPVVIASDQSSIATQGAKTNNNAAPGATNIGSLSAIANAAAPTWTEGNLVALSVDLSGNQRVTMGTALAASLDSVAIGGGLMPTSTALNTYATRITSNTTTTPTSATAYISSIAICVETAGTTSTIDIRDKSGTPIYLVRSLSTAAVFTNGIDVFTFNTPLKMTSGIDIITGGAAAATVSVFINYYA